MPEDTQDERDRQRELVLRLIAEYVNTATNQDDYRITYNKIIALGLDPKTALDMMENDGGVRFKRSALQSIPGPDTVTGDYTQEIAPTPEDALRLDQKINFETPGREQIPEDLFGKWGVQRGAIANFIQDKYGQTSGAFRNFLTNQRQQDALASRFDLASTADPQGSEGGFSKFMQGLAPEMFRTSGPNRGQLDLLSRYLGTPDSGAYNIPIPQRDAIEGFRTDQQKQFDLLMNPLIANLSPYSTGGFQRSAQAGFDEWMGRNLENPNAQYLPYIAGRNFVP